MLYSLFKISLLTCLLLISHFATASTLTQKHNDLDALWNRYNYSYIDHGRVVSLDENHITTSEGQSYGMLRAVWSGDRDTFEAVWAWTQQHLSRTDHLFSWKWKGKILDHNAATDADTDIALALLLAAERFDQPAYKRQALLIINSIWEREVVEYNGKYYLTGGNWAPKEKYPTIHVGYLAPYAYEIFSQIDLNHPWKELITSSYDILDWIYLQQGFLLPPEKLYLDKQNGRFLLNKPGQHSEPLFSYDVFPIFWRIATDEQWFGRGKSELRQKMLLFFEQEWLRHGKIFDRYTLQGQAKSTLEGLPLYATIASLSRVNESPLFNELESQKLPLLWKNALVDKNTPYYLHNWLWFDRALELKTVRHFREFLAFLYPFDVVSFNQHFPLILLLVFLTLVALLRVVPEQLQTWFKIATLTLGLFLCGRYLLWRALHSLNFIEGAGPYISIALFIAEFYCFTTVLFLLIQVGVKPLPKQQPAVDTEYDPEVDVFIPIYSESLEILEATLMAAQMMNYKNKKVFVCDDSHRDSVQVMAEKLGCHYIKGPKKHAKAGNINHALGQTTGELVLIFDTDHIPVVSFLDETVPLLADPEVGFVQTSHHFYNPDIFQNALRTPPPVSDEQDFFHHGIQPARDKWGGAFFVGTGALFRRKALDEVGGLLLMSITEDIHTSQHLHARGWKSRYVSKNLAVGLNAENLASYLVQRTRWMQGCLQVFFKDNPLFHRGLPLRHRLGYFASQYYFFFPIARMIFFMAPLFYLFFHWHPIFADLAKLLAYLIPFMICLPILSQLLVPGWPRVVWASAYENTVSASLFRGMIDLVLPKTLSFKVTPKGINNVSSRFDFRSSLYSIVVLSITLFGIVKGLFEYFYFQIEKDAYFFNLSWAFVNLLLLMTPLIIAREHPRYAYQNRIRKNIPLTISAPGFLEKGRTFDIDLTGFSMEFHKPQLIPNKAIVNLIGESELVIPAQFVFYDSDERGVSRICFDFEPTNEAQRQWLLRHIHCDPITWEQSMAVRSKSNVVMVFHFFKGLLKSLWKPQELRRQQPRSKRFQLFKIVIQNKQRWAIEVNHSLMGKRVVVLDLPPIGSDRHIHLGDHVSIPDRGQEKEYEVVYCRSFLFLPLKFVGLKIRSKSS